MDSEDDLLCVLAAVIKQRKKLRKTRKNISYMGSADLQRKKEIWRITLSESNEDL